MQWHDVQGRGTMHNAQCHGTSRNSATLRLEVQCRNSTWNVVLDAQCRNSTSNVVTQCTTLRLDAQHCDSTAQCHSNNAANSAAQGEIRRHKEQRPQRKGRSPKSECHSKKGKCRSTKSNCHGTKGKRRSTKRKMPRHKEQMLQHKDQCKTAMSMAMTSHYRCTG